MANLSISSATYGRDSAGAAKLRTNLLGDIQAARKALKGADYQRVITTVRQNWAGADADKFVKEFKATVNKIYTDFETYGRFIDTALADDKRQFTKMQATNASRITGH